MMNAALVMLVTLAGTRRSQALRFGLPHPNAGQLAGSAAEMLDEKNAAKAMGQNRQPCIL
jgi:hypothetical protein